MKNAFLYFYDAPGGEVIELYPSTVPVANAKVADRFPGVKALKWDSFSKLMAPRKNSGNDIFNVETYLPVTRKIEYKARPSLHECNARCMGGKCNGVCECKCGGKNHGINNAR